MRRRGFVLVVVIFFTVLLFSGIATFLRRSTLDAAIVRNRDYAARAEALARGGVRLGIVLLQQDRARGAGAAQPAGRDAADLWAARRELAIPTEDGGTLQLRIEDAASRIDLNGLATDRSPSRPRTSGRDGALPRWASSPRSSRRCPGAPRRSPTTPRSWPRNLIDYLDEDDVGQRGEPENAWYQEQDPPYRTSPDARAALRGRARRW